MRDRMERLVILPFSVGCMSEASVAVGVPQPRKSRPAATKECEGEEGGKNSSGMVVVPKSNVSAGLNKLMKGFKSLSQMFGEKEDELEEDGEGGGGGGGGDDEEEEMQIGGPTDVQHVTHIGWDGHAITTANPPLPMSRWDLLSLSLHQ
ncbi:CRIB domain-containing protein RIC4 isoform X2 [Neltuma alba]|uniref:CRIB domain-containing protein RIC4 isoform X2 n=1 Tax=Neltuma alba TaxID=207710 RepID=UPI0010A38B39|nr:CRIB domain-containing protein RIC4-like isoform X2 [Prosopis alba]